MKVEVLVRVKSVSSKASESRFPKKCRLAAVEQVIGREAKTATLLKRRSLNRKLRGGGFTGMRILR
ncbi:MAG: hypothetical protein M3525_05990 [Acidobacteriota bacterium]|nr:hypothetical protein [Acidobacteriota bacterium]